MLPADLALGQEYTTWTLEQSQYFVGLCVRVIRQAKKGRTQTNPNPIYEENVGVQI